MHLYRFSWIFLIGCFLIFIPPTTYARPPYAAIASVTISAPNTVFIGETFTFTLTFDNTDPTDTGFGPFIDLVFPVTGIDGDDGIDFVSATMLGGNVPAQRRTFPASGCVNHPYARDTTNRAVQVCGVPGNELVVLQVPLGAVPPSHPPVRIVVTAQVDPFADLNAALSIFARGGFRFGNDALNDPCCDPTILTPTTPTSTAWPTASVRPIVIDLEKTTSRFADENATGEFDETVSGPNFAAQYTITIDIANGQTITDLDVTDLLPPNLEFLAVDLIASTPGANVLSTNPLIVNYASVTGTLANDDVEVVFDYQVPQLDTSNNPVLNPTTGNDTSANNNAEAVGDWVPGDPRDSASADNAIAPGGNAPEHTLFIRSLAMQKNVAIVNDTGGNGPTPGDTLEYTLAFQISDFFTFGDLVLTDIFADGQRLDAGFAPNFTITDRSGTFAGNFAIGTELIVDTSQIGNDTNPATNGSTRLVFNISTALINQGDDGILQGGRAIAPNSIGAIGQITYRTIIQETFSDTFPSGGPAVDIDDLMTNTGVLDGTVRSNTAIGTVTDTESDDSLNETFIENGAPGKTIYAVNNTVCDPCTNVVVDPLDTITFRLRYTLPTSDVDNLRLVDFLPQPVMDATSLNTFDPTISAAPPPAGTAKFGPAESFFAVSNLTPTLVQNAANNTITFDYGRFSDQANTESQIDLLYTLTITNTPYADGLTLANFVAANPGSTNATPEVLNASAQFVLRQPLLIFRKSVVSTDNPTAQLTPPAFGSVTFAPPGSGGPTWTGFINSNNLDAANINSDLSNALPGDLVRFALVIENIGSTPEGAFDIRIRDTLTPGFIIPTGGINLDIRRGDGMAINFTPLGTANQATDLFINGLELIDPSPTEGACQSFDPTDGANIVVITYDLQIDPNAPANNILTNRGEITNYSAVENATNHVQDAQLFADIATVRLVGAADTTQITLSKTGVLSTGALGLIGEEVTWILTISNPTATQATNITVSDTIPSELRLNSAEIERGTVAINGQTVTFSIPTLNAGESLTALVFTTIVSIPPDGIVENTALLTTTNGSRTATAQLDLVTGLPATGYPPIAESNPDVIRRGKRFEHLLWIVGLTLIGLWVRRRRF